MDNPTGPQRSSSQLFSLDRLLSLEVTGPLGPGMWGGGVTYWVPGAIHSASDDLRKHHALTVCLAAGR